MNRAKWSRFLVAILVLTMSVWALAGCGGSDIASEEGESDETLYIATDVTSDLSMADAVKEYYDKVDTKFGYDLAHELAYSEELSEQLGWRLAGSDPEHACADFLADKSAVNGRLKLTIRIGQVLGIGLVFAVRALVLLLKDGKLQENGKINQKEYPKALVCFSVIDEDGGIHDTWEEKSVQTDWINYCVSGDVEKEAVVCEFTGKLAPAAVKHPKTLMRFAANAKLISSNDSNGMTYLGRFSTPDEVCTISSEASYCFHSAVKWAEDRAVSFKKGKDKDVTDYMSWCMETPNTHLSNNDEQRGYAESQNQYYLQVQNALKGKLENAKGKHLVFMTTGSVSPGHMAISGFRVGSADDIFRNEAAWNRTSSFFTKGKNGENVVRAPSVGEIIYYAFGTERKDLTGKYSMNVNEKIYARQLYILTQCVTENKAVPDLVLERLMRKASSIRNFCDYKNFAHSRFIVCALARKKMIEDKRLKEEDSMEFNLDTASIDMLFGALLAIYDKAERDFCDKHKVTNAQNLEPQYISQTADTLVKLRLAAKPYLDKARKSYGGCYLEQYICELMCKLGERLAEKGIRMEDVEQLGPEYMIGFELMKKTLYSKKVNNNSQKKQE